MQNLIYNEVIKFFALHIINFFPNSFLVLRKKWCIFIKFGNPSSKATRKEKAKIPRCLDLSDRGL